MRHNYRSCQQMSDIYNCEIRWCNQEHDYDRRESWRLSPEAGNKEEQVQDSENSIAGGSPAKRGAAQAKQRAFCRGEEWSICARCCDGSDRGQLRTGTGPRMWWSLVTLARAHLVEWWKREPIETGPRKWRIGDCERRQLFWTFSLKESGEIGW